ncbi:calcium binding EGF domain protein [Teladorsagia circumcincta]|uniref:Calcium binding EGF domain protein n=1 Tax=Teladorsagia circumcincta TaxID=45464 RepID=A0A2G9UQH9_TELCI|nr:calcium binding EGF domain protein [Teladorsagia circumcincta]
MYFSTRKAEEFNAIKATFKPQTVGTELRGVKISHTEPINHALLNECADKTLNDCDPAATCMDNPLSYECLCRENFLDVSPDPVKKPGRKCIKSLADSSELDMGKQTRLGLGLRLGTRGTEPL